VQQFYELEGRRRRPTTIRYLLFCYGGFVLIFAAGFIGFALTGDSWIPPLLLVAAMVGWWYAGPRLWRNKDRATAGS